MKRRLTYGSIVLLFAAMLSCSSFSEKEQTRSLDRNVPQESSFLTQPMPVDSSVTIGSLDNGLTYYIRQNKKPENRVELRLVVKAGSVLEDDHQQGLAHFVEHMAFNGTDHFEKHELVNYLESIGMRFGPDLNAYTSFDETVYMLQVPSENSEILETSFQILSDWAHAISFEDEEIEKERGVIIEEWRSGRGAAARIRDKQYPVLLKDSRYAKRLPIGKEDLIASFEHDTLRRFYKDWYRPDLMAVIAVGDIEQSHIQNLIERHFGTIPPAENPRKRKLFPVPDHEEILYAIVTDPEATQSTVGVYYKHDVERDETVEDYRTSIIENLFDTMFDKRLDEIARDADPPYLYAYSGTAGLLTKDFYILGAAVDENGVEHGFEAILTEAERIRRYGFTQTELDRAGTELLRSMESYFSEKDKTESAEYASEYIRNFTEKEAIPGIEYEYHLYRKFVPEITLEEVNNLAEQRITDNNRVVMVSMPEKDGIRAPDKNTLNAMFDRVSQKDIQPYIDTVSDEPLAEMPQKHANIIEEVVIEELGVTIWTLDNGIRVVLKPTEFKNDEIIFEAASPGGHSLVPDSVYVSASLASGIINQSGAGIFNLTELEKKLSGKVVAVAPWITELQEGLSGNASPHDIETLFQLIYLYFTEPREDTTAFQSYLSRLRGFIENRGARPEAAFSDTAQVTLADYHFRSRPWTLGLLNELSLDDAYKVYCDRFADAGDFTFYFVGALDIEKIRPLVTTWLGNLPNTDHTENWADINEDYPQGIIVKEIQRGIEEKSRVQLHFTGPFEWNRRNRYIMDSMIRTLRIRLREIIREEMSGTYGVGVYHDLTHYPDETYHITISFGCEPARVDELVSTITNEIKTMQNEGATKQYLDKVKEIQRREHELQLKENDYWLNVLSMYEFHNEDIRQIRTYNDLVDSLTLGDIQQAANRYFNFENYIRIVLLPEKAE